MPIARRRWFGLTAGALVGGMVTSAAQANALADGLRFEIFQDARKEYRWRLKAANNQIIATSGEGYKAKADCRHGIELVQSGAKDAKVDDLTGNA
jgi:uncharacterized protein YegP (UPF0339 family)